MSHTELDFGESAEITLEREGDITHLKIHAPGGDDVWIRLHDGCSGPVGVIDLNALTTRNLINEGYRSEVDINVQAAMKRLYALPYTEAQPEATA